MPKCAGGKKRVSVPVCRNSKGRFQKTGTAKKAAKKPGKKKLSYKRPCKPKTMWKDKRGVCHCYTKGGGAKTVRKGAKCKRIKRRKPPRHLR
jgi:hypothetical protein